MLERLRKAIRGNVPAAAPTYPPDPPAEEVHGVYYSSLEDEDTCRVCAAADDGLLRRLDDPTRVRAPHVRCSSPKGCRCAEVYVLKDEMPPSDGYSWSPESARLNAVDAP